MIRLPLFRSTLYFILFCAIAANASFLNADPLHQFYSSYDFVGNDPILKIDRTGKGWKDALSVDMKQYVVEIDFSEVMVSKRLDYRVADSWKQLELNQHRARARSLLGNYSEEFRVAIPGQFGKALKSSSVFLNVFDICNCSSFVLGAHDKGFLLTTKSTPLPILDHSDIFEALIPQPIQAGLISFPARKNDIVVEYIKDTKPDSFTYFHSVRIAESSPHYRNAVYVEKNQLQGKISTDSYTNNSQRYIKPYRLKPLPEKIPKSNFLSRYLNRFAHYP